MLKHGNPSDAALRLDSDEKDTLDNTDSGNINRLGTVGVIAAGLHGMPLMPPQAPACRCHVSTPREREAATRIVHDCHHA